MQELRGGFGIDRMDGGIEYLTLGAIAEFDWCPYTADTLGRYLRDPKKMEPWRKFSDGMELLAIPGSRNGPARYSMAAVREFCEWLQGDVGNPGVYFIRPPGSRTLKIGETKRLEGRLEEFAIAGRKAACLRWVPCVSKKAAQKLEKELHDKYDRHRVDEGAEWFWIEGRLARDLGLPEEQREEVSA